MGKAYAESINPFLTPYLVFSMNSYHIISILLQLGDGTLSSTRLHLSLQPQITEEHTHRSPACASHTVIPDRSINLNLPIPLILTPFQFFNPPDSLSIHHFLAFTLATSTIPSANEGTKRTAVQDSDDVSSNASDNLVVSSSEYQDVTPCRGRNQPGCQS